MDLYSSSYEKVDLKNYQNFYFIGIGGSGMGPLAEFQKQTGFNVNGSDLKSSSTTDYLSSIGIDISFDIDTAKRFISSINQPTLVVISSAIKQDNPLYLESTKNPNIKIIHRSTLVAHICNQSKLLAIAGTHGKTTTSSMLAHTLTTLGLDPSYIIGGKLLGTSSLSHKGTSDLIVAEVDESDGSILKYRPYVASITNIAPDHLDYFKTLENEVSTFKSYLEHTQNNGACVLFSGINEVGINTKDIADVFKNKDKNQKNTKDIDVICFGFDSNSDIFIESIETSSNKTQYSLNVFGKSYSSSIGMFGKHNILNICTVVGVCVKLGLDVSKVLEALSSYKGVKRRMNLIYETNLKGFNIKVYDDYAHNPGKIQASIKGLKEAFKGYQLNILYQPHRYSRLQTMYEQTMSSFKLADKVYVFEVYAAGESNTDQDKFNSGNIACDITKYSQVKAIPLMQNETILDKINFDDISSNQVYVSLGAGDIYVQANLLKNYLKTI